MKKLGALAGILLSVQAAMAVGTCPDKEAYVPDRVIVHYRPGLAAAAAAHGRRLHRFVDGTELHAVSSVEAFREVADQDPAVDWWEPDYIITLDATPNDKYFGVQWGLKDVALPDADISAEQSWEVTTGSRSVIVADIDTGIDFTHPDLVPNVWSNPGEVPGNGVDDDGNGYTDDVHGYDFYEVDADPQDLNSHGTHTAGTIGAAGNNSLAVAGVAWSVSLLPVRFLGPCGSGTTSDAILALDYVTGLKLRGQNIVAANNSWGSSSYSQALADAIGRMEAAGVLIVASAGNAARDSDVFPNYPASLPNQGIISVAAIDPNAALASFSTYGASTVDLGAPGVGINSTWLMSFCSKDGLSATDCVGSLSGTSMAAPHVAGVAALIASVRPGATAADIKAAILGAVDPTPALAGRTVTGGRLNAARAVGYVPPPPPVTTFCGDTTCNAVETCRSCGSDCWGRQLGRPTGKKYACCGDGVQQPGEAVTVCDGRF